MTSIHYLGLLKSWDLTSSEGSFRLPVSSQGQQWMLSKYLHSKKAEGLQVL